MARSRPFCRFAAACCAALLAVLATALPAQGVSPGGPPISPFRAMRAVDGTLHVQVDGDTWYALEAVHGVDVDTLLRESRRLCGERWWKRVTEDLPALLDAMGHPVEGTTVDLRLTAIDSGKVVERTAVPMTAANRRLLWQANKERDEPRGLQLPPEHLAVADAHADLDALRELLDTRFAYRELRTVDLDALVATAKQRLGGGGGGDGARGNGRDGGGDSEVERTALAREVDAILRAFGDGHSRLAGGQLATSTRFLPFLVQRAADGYTAFWPDRSGLVDPLRPFVAAIDGVPLARWLEAAGSLASQGSAAMVARDAERLLREIEPLRERLSLPANPRVAVTVRAAAADAGADREVLIEAATRRPVYGSWPRTQTRVLDGNVGYLRLPEMAGDATFLDSIDAAMERFRDTQALIVDVRGNGGGSRDALRRLFPYLLGADDPPQVVNAAAVLLTAVGVASDGAADGDLLADRGMHRADWHGWTDAQRTAITTFARGFTPEWKLPKGRFSPLHFLVLHRADNGKAFAYDKPVRVLIDGGCFSATDVFVAALRTRPQVRLVGSATSGGSGRAHGHRLPRSGLRLQLSTMASFRPDGKLFEGNGCEPDVACLPAPADLAVGGGDAVLDRALASLRGERRSR